jgi:hypothetical protein
VLDDDIPIDGLVEVRPDRQQPVTRLPAYQCRGQIEGPRCAVVGQLDADVDPDAEADARNGDAELPRVLQVEPQRCPVE